MWKEESCVDTAMMNDSKRLQIILECMPNDNGMSVDELVHRLAHRSQVPRRFGIVFRINTGKPGVVVTEKVSVRNASGIHGRNIHDMNAIVHLYQLVKHEFA